MRERRRSSLRAIRAALTDFYGHNRRDLPWRRTRDPYAIWISEVMCQQTQVDTVVPRFTTFMRQFPNTRALAASSVEQVCEAWAGLGYYRRARNLHAAAQVITGDLGGELPRDETGLRALPGIGRYTAGAIASIAFDAQVPVVDGNVTRVLSRLFAIGGDPKRAATQHRLWEMARELVRGEAPGDFNQAMMELGALICTPRAPRCDDCPTRRWCYAKRSGRQAHYPASRPAPARATLRIAFAWIRGRDGVWLQRRPVEGLWAGLWELPSASGRTARAGLAKRLGVELSGPMARLQHELTHRSVKAAVYRPVRVPRLLTALNLKRYSDPLQAPVSTLARKAIEAALAAEGEK